MTFDEALELKTKTGNTIVEKGISMKVFVAPKSEKHISKYFGHYMENSHSFTDSIAKLYAENNEYICCGLAIVDFNILFKRIEK
jgi:hypothetical protein